MRPPAMLTRHLHGSTVRSQRTHKRTATLEPIIYNIRFLYYITHTERMHIYCCKWRERLQPAMQEDASTVCASYRFFFGAFAISTLLILHSDHHRRVNLAYK